MRAIHTQQPPRFTTLRAIDGVEIIDERGRPVGKRETLQSANGYAWFLNDAARRGPCALARALRIA